METQIKIPNNLFEINIGTVVNAEWTKFLKKVEVLGSGNFGTVYLTEDISNGKQYVVKEVFT